MMSKLELHAIIVDKSLQDLTMLKGLNVLSEKKASDWTLYKVSVPESGLLKTIKMIQENMTEGLWYFHFYNEDGSRLVIVYEDKVFYTDNNIENWNEAIAYGKSIGIPLEQLNFVPNTFETEEY